jgi:S1-C subfamily serine protease
LRSPSLRIGCVDRIIETGSVGRATLGVVARTLSAAEADWESRVGFALSEGAFVREVIPGSPAAKAGVRELDVIERLGPHFAISARLARCAGGRSRRRA